MARTKTITGSKVSSSAGLFLRIVTGLAVILFLASGWGWWHFIRSNPENVFREMIANSLKNTGVTDRVLQSNNGQKQDQKIELMTSPKNLAHSVAVVTQDGSDTTNVTTETIGTPFLDYVRYTDINTDQKDASGKPLDFSKVKNIWSKTSSTEDTTSTAGQIYNQTILSVVPIANLPAGQRSQLLKQIKDQGVYDVDYSSVQRHIESGRPVYTYKITIKPQPYVAMLKTLGHDLGLSQLETVDPANYSGAAPVGFSIGIDVWSRQLKSITYNSSTDNSRSEIYGSYGLQKNIVLPKNTISTDELQLRVQSLQ